MVTLDAVMLAGLLALMVVQYKRTGVLLTPSNAALVSMLILPVFVGYFFSLSRTSLETVGQYGHAFHMQWAADELLQVISMGTAAGVITYLALARFVRPKKISNGVTRTSKFSESQWTIGASVTGLIGCAAVWYFFVTAGIPLLSSASHARETLESGHPTTRYLYTGGFTFMNIGIIFLVAGLALGVIVSYRALAVIIASACSLTNLLTASRGNLLFPLVVAACIYFSVKSAKLTIGRAIFYMLALLLAASMIQSLRNRQTISLETSMDEILYGNTFFTGLRDSSWVLMDFEAHHYPLYHGKTMLAGLLGFIPSSIAPFRSQYGWGNVTLRVVNIDPSERFGLAHVLFADWYINFGLPGVILVGALLGAILLLLDKRLYAVRSGFRKKVPETFFKIFQVWFLWLLSGTLLDSSQSAQAYPYLLGFFSLIFFASVTRTIFGSKQAGTFARQDGWPVNRISSRP